MEEINRGSVKHYLIVNYLHCTLVDFKLTYTYNIFSYHFMKHPDSVQFQKMMLILNSESSQTYNFSIV